MRPVTDSGRFLQPITGQLRDLAPQQVNQEILIRLTGLIQLSVGTIDLLIVLRYLLNLLEASILNPFAGVIYVVSEPFVSVFHGLTRSPVYRDLALELNTLIAILAYSVLGWIAIRLIRILFASPK